MTASSSTATSTTACRWRLRYEYHSENEFARDKSHVNGIENMQTCGLRGASPSGGLRSSTVAASPRSCYTRTSMHSQRSFTRWRYNHRNDDLLALIKRLYRKTYLD